jgi:regulator of protease activity HflC (stomatin/prohibitin superfamily)
MTDKLDSLRGLKAGCIAMAIAAVVLVAWCSFTTVQAGHVGVVTTFGRVHPEHLVEGAHVLAPWNSVHQMSLRTEEVKEVMDVPTKEGVTVQLEASLLYSLNPEKAADVYQKIGLEYPEKVVKPQFRSAARNTTVNFEARDLYTGNRTQVELALEKETRDALMERGIQCEKVLLRKMDLPPTIKASIDQKMVADQKAQAMEYELKAAEQDAKKKKIEAEAIATAKLAAMKVELETAKMEAEKRQIEAEATAKAQETIKKTLDDNYIRYLWVQALETGAKNRSATIYVPTGHDGLPLVSTAGPSSVATGSKGEK